MGTVRPTTEARVKATADVHAAIVAEAPVSNLVTPSWHVGLSDRVKDYKPYGSDYYVVRADLFVTAAAPPPALPPVTSHPPKPLKPSPEKKLSPPPPLPDSAVRQYWERYCMARVRAHIQFL